jgi:hypothetical protein
LEGIREQTEDACSTVRNIKLKKDHSDKYGDVVASSLRQLDEWHRDSAIHKIGKILYEEKRMYLGRLQSHSSRANHPLKLPTGGPSQSHASHPMSQVQHTQRFCEVQSGTVSAPPQPFPQPTTFQGLEFTAHGYDNVSKNTKGYYEGKDLGFHTVV